MELEYEKSYLNETKELVKKALSVLGAELGRAGSEMHDENRFLWEDMPRHIRDFDDTVNLAVQNERIQELRGQRSERMLRRKLLEKMLLKPYFGRVDFTEEADISRSFYIGIANLMDESTYEQRVCDWRAPVAALYYENEKGVTGYESPDGLVRGEVTLLRQYDIADGELVSYVDPELKIDDDILVRALGGVSGERMKTIVQTIQREQNRVIRDSSHELLIVLGPAGSGKTSIALHRVAYLLFRDQPKLTSKNILVFSPNHIFSDYISDVIPELGEHEVMTTTFADMISSYCGESVAGMFEQADFLNSPKLTPQDETRAAGIIYKNSHAFLDELERAAAEYVPDFRDVVFCGNAVITADELRTLYGEAYSHMKIYDRLGVISDEIRRRFAPLEKEFRQKLRAELEDGVQSDMSLDMQTRRAFLEAAADATAAIRDATAPDVREIYCRILERCAPDSGIAGETAQIRQSAKLRFEDGVGIMLLMALFGMIPKVKQIKHVVIDEVQDYSPAQHRVFATLFSQCTLTMLGDDGQLINKTSGMTSGEEIAAIYNRESGKVIRLDKSYRSTEEISRFACQILRNRPHTEFVERHGEKIGLLTVRGFRENALCIEEMLDELSEQPGSTVVITRTTAEAVRYYQSVRRGCPKLRLMSESDGGFLPGLLVAPITLAKGLEFDRVIIADSSGYTSEADRTLLYAACTRAMHRLTICAVGAQSPLLPPCDGILSEVI